MPTKSVLSCAIRRGFEIKAHQGPQAEPGDPKTRRGDGGRCGWKCGGKKRPV